MLAGGERPHGTGAHRPIAPQIEQSEGALQDGDSDVQIAEFDDPRVAEELNQTTREPQRCIEASAGRARRIAVAQRAYACDTYRSAGATRPRDVLRRKGTYHCST